MSNLRSIDPEIATGKTKELLEFVQERSGRIPNMIRLLANSPAALGAYLSFAGAFREAALPAKTRDLIAVTVAKAAGSGYTLAAVTTMARRGGRSDSELRAARSASADDPKIAAALRFAAKMVDKRAHLSKSDISSLRRSGFSDAEIAEIIASVVLNLYRSYFNLLAQPEMDFPLVETGEARAS